GVQCIQPNGDCVPGHTVPHFAGTVNANPSSDNTCACEIFNSSNNKVFGNTFSGNIDKNGAPCDICRLISGTGNCGDNISGAPACAVTACPPLLTSQSSSAPCTVVPIP